MPMRFLLAAALALATFAARADLSENDLASAARLREAALASPLAYELVTSLTTEVGARMAGSEADPRAVAWAVARLKSLGFANVLSDPAERTSICPAERCVSQPAAIWDRPALWMHTNSTMGLSFIRGAFSFTIG